MLTHHIITSTLLGSAYVYGFYNVANVVLCIMDIVDFLLPVSVIGATLDPQLIFKVLTVSVL